MRKIIAAWGGGVLGEQPFTCFLFDSLQALTRTGLLQELPERNVSPASFSKLDFSRQFLVTYSWPDLNGQSVTTTRVDTVQGGIRIHIEVVTSKEHIPQFGTSGILVHALAVDRPIHLGTFHFQVNGQTMDFQVLRP